MTGLRDRKKSRTRARIQERALALFRVQGFAATTVEALAQAAGVSPATFYRYFPTKEDVVVQDVWDTAFVEAVITQPAGQRPIRAIRETLQAFLTQLTPEQLHLERERLLLILATPALRARLFGTYPDALRRVAGVLTARGTPAAEARLLAGALLGVALAAMVGAADDPEADYFALFDEGLARLTPWDAPAP